MLSEVRRGANRRDLLFLNKNNVGFLNIAQNEKCACVGVRGSNLRPRQSAH